MIAARKAAIGLCALSAVGTNALADDWFPLRNQNPFVQIYGLPAFAGAGVVGHRESQFRVGLDITNHADLGTTETEDIVIDGESYYFDLSYRRGIADWLELGIELPLVAHRSGFLDNMVEGWHDLLGLSNSKRQGPPNQILFSYTKQSVIDYTLSNSTFGIGDLRITAATPLRVPESPGDIALALRSTVKLPTGDPDRLHGSGATDLALSLHAALAGPIGFDSINLTGFAGAMWTGDSDRFAAIQEQFVPFAGGAAAWRVIRSIDLVGQVYAQGQFYDSELDELAGKSVQLGIGMNYRPEKADWLVTLGFVEDIVGDTTPDFALHLSIRSSSGGNVRP